MIEIHQKKKEENPCSKYFDDKILFSLLVEYKKQISVPIIFIHAVELFVETDFCCLAWNIFAWKCNYQTFFYSEVENIKYRWVISITKIFHSDQLLIKIIKTHELAHLN